MSADVIAAIDWSKVEQAVLTNPDGSEAQLLSYDYEDVKAMIFAAAEKWLGRDLAQLTNVQTEQEFRSTNLCRYPVRGFIDLNGIYAGGELRGKRLVADWKTSEGELDINWQNRLFGSFQWPLYARELNADFFSYRGISRKCKTREVFIEVPRFAITQVERQFRLVGEQIHATATEPVWSMKKPSSCGAYNSVCQFLNECQTDTMPQYGLVEEEISLSYSGMDRFQLCPEKFRRVAKTTDEGTDSTRLGSAFHRGIEEVYRQSFDLK